MLGLTIFITAPAHPHASLVAVYPASFFVLQKPQMGKCLSVLVKFLTLHYMYVRIHFCVSPLFSPSVDMLVYRLCFFLVFASSPRQTIHDYIAVYPALLFLTRDFLVDSHFKAFYRRHFLTDSVFFYLSCQPAVKR